MRQVNTKSQIKIEPEEVKGPLEHDGPSLREWYKPVVLMSRYKLGQSQLEP